MKTHYNYLAIITITLLVSFSAHANKNNHSDLSSIIKTLSNVDQMIKSGKKFVQTKYEQHSSSGSGTKTTPSQIDLIGGKTAASENTNPFLSIFRMLPDYVIIMKFHSNSNSGKKVVANGGNVVNVTNPVAQALLGVEFIFTPIYNKGDNKITTWACFTNADYYKSEYIQDNTAPLYERSYIADIAEQARVIDLSSCIYMGPNLASYITPYRVKGFGYDNNNDSKK